MCSISWHTVAPVAVAAALACTPRPDATEAGNEAGHNLCEAAHDQHERFATCLIAEGWDTVLAQDRALYLRFATADGSAADAASPHPRRVSAAVASELVGQQVRVVDSVVAIYLGNRRVPFQIRLGRDSATTTFTLLVDWAELSRFPVLKWRNRVIAANGTVEFMQGVPVILLDDEGQARIVEGPHPHTPQARATQ